MTGYILRRLLQFALVLLVVTALVFTLLHMSGNPAALLLPANATPEQVEQMSHSLGLDDPLYVQYFRYLANLFRGDLGTSYRMNLPVTRLIRIYLPHTLTLAGLSILFATAISLVLGIAAALKRDTVIDLAATVGATIGQSMPTFWLAILLLLLFGVKLRWLPVSGVGSWAHYVLPTITMGWYSASFLTRTIRSNMLDVLRADYVQVARSKGLPERAVILRHAFRNVLLPVVTIWGLQLGTLLMGSVVTETVFAWPGVGRLSAESVLGRDYPVVLGLIVVFGVMFGLLNVCIDISYALLDPRVTYD
ncbi:MAG: ABC transporter permease [Candidatus Bipolaricaulis sp.]|nr:ABC transporter permease [Candidatus Bipolaricaulis sp.]MDD5646705.1 ABC transporter permease [Candidatus Bipolaricaulis sp.]